MKETVLLLLILSPKIIGGSSTNPYSIEFTESTCGDGCINGDDAGTCPISCSCEVNGIEYFTGSKCEVVLFNNDIINSSTSARTANFTWPSDPNIAADLYKFVYMKTDDNDNETYVDDFEMITDVTARLTELEAGEVTYRVCVVNSSVANDDTIDIDFASNETCISVTTDEGGIDWVFTVAAIVVGFGIILAVVVLITLRLILDGIQNREESRKKKGYSTVGVEKKAKQKVKNVESDTEKPKAEPLDNAEEADEVVGYTNPVLGSEYEDTGGNLKESKEDGIKKGRGSGMYGSYQSGEVYEELDAGGHSLYGDSHTGGSEDQKQPNELEGAQAWPQYSQRKPTDSETPTYLHNRSYKTGVEYSEKDHKSFRNQPEWDKHRDPGPDYMEQRPQHDYYNYSRSSNYQQKYPLDRDKTGSYESRGYLDLNGTDLHRASADNYSLPEPDY